MKRPCLVCSEKDFNCTYEKARKKRGPTGKRIQEIQKAQGKPVNRAKSSEHSHEITRESVATVSPSIHDSTGLPRPTTVSSNGTGEAEPIHLSPEGPFWPSESMPQPDVSEYPSMYGHSSDPLHRISSATTFSEASAPAGGGMASSPTFSEFVFPSLPMDSPTKSWDPFGALLQQDLPDLTATVDVWPSSINEETLLPWIDVYFKRLHPTIPILNRTSMYREMLTRRHHTDSEYGAMLLSLCAFAMTQPVQIHERASTPSRSAQARMLMEECVRMRVSAEFGEHPSIEMILASFFLFAYLFGDNKHKAARHRLREAVDLAYSLGLHLPQSYEGLDAEVREQWLRTYLVVCVTERAYALQQQHSIGFRGSPRITARFMQAFDPNAATAYISSLLLQDQADAVGMTGLLYLMETFDAIDESVIECWNGHCRYTDGTCDSFDRRRALQMFRAQHRAREACVTGNISFAPSASPLPLAELMESQQADISITQFWLLNRLWNLCLSHGLLRGDSEHAELRYEFACRIAMALIATTNSLSLAAMETHGVGLIQKVSDVALGVVTAMRASPQHIGPETTLAVSNEDVILIGYQTKSTTSIRELLGALSVLIQTFRGGDHVYNAGFADALSSSGYG
ncbi:hypothetical protein LTR37_020118 [Vermiconidia calcicola]|uniref:Uncharacterized protein n=1 Tax=Vermiconidia calcicola TaxID=1690605 RepID=A0ACC3ME57_9PEZI|nr:hypothetical protein LTR37_020118 [Vermiconidia calcicola]